MWRISISRSGVLKGRAPSKPTSEVKVTVGRNHQGLDPSATARERSPSARLADRAFVVKFESKDLDITTKMRQPDRRPSRDVAFIADSTGRAVQPVKPDGEDARPSTASNAFPRSVLVPIDQFRSKYFIV
jgi:hypothetical protein